MCRWRRTSTFPDTAGYDDRKAVLVIRQGLEDDSKEMVVALHGGGLMHLAWRPAKGADDDGRCGSITGRITPRIV